MLLFLNDLRYLQQLFSLQWSKRLNSGLKHKKKIKKKNPNTILGHLHAFLLLWGSSLSAKCSVLEYSGCFKKKRQHPPTTHHLLKKLIEWNFEQIRMIIMLPTGNNIHFNRFSFIASYLCSPSFTSYVQDQANYHLWTYRM